METVTLSSKYQVVIPWSVRVSLGLKPGMELQVIEYSGRVEFVCQDLLTDPFGGELTPSAVNQ